jgi:hypothetical protein
LQQKETYHLLCLCVLQCWNSMEANNDSPKTQTSGDIGFDGIMEMDPGPMENNDDSNGDNLKICDTGTICYDLIPSSLVPSDHMISTFQQGHQTFPVTSLAMTTIPFCPWSPSVWTIHSPRPPNSICTQLQPSSYI